MGFGADSLSHTSNILRLSEGLPIVVEVIDHPNRLRPLIDLLATLAGEGMVTREPVDVLAYRHS